MSKVLLYCALLRVVSIQWGVIQWAVFISIQLIGTRYDISRAIDFVGGL